MNSGALLGFFPNFAPDRFGGVELSGRLAWQGIRDGLAQRGETPFLFCYAPGMEPGFLSAQQVVVRSKIEAVWRALQMSAKPRVILVWHLALLKLVPWLRAPQARVAVFLHGIEAWRKQDPLTRLVLSRVDVFFANSQYTYNRFLQANPSLVTIAHEIVPLGTDVPEQGISEPLAPPRMLILGRLARAENYKGHRELIQVWRHVRVQVPGAELWIAGDGDLRPDLERMATALDLGTSVRFWGGVSEVTKQKLLRECRAFAMPSRGEGFGLAYVEAMRVGRPCLVSDCDAGREVVNPPEAGLAVNPGDANALIAAICQLLTPGEAWKRKSLAAQSRYAAQYTAARFQQRWLDALANKALYFG